MSVIDTIKEQLPQLQPAEIEEVERLIGELRLRRERQKEAARNTIGAFAAGGESVDGFLAKKHAEGEQW